jgi:large subunit ribosomal protein L7Ae
MVKVEIPKELADQILKLVEDARAGGKIRKGTNEATKSVERAEAKFVVIAADVNPPEIIQHIPMLCEEKKIPCAFVPAKADLGAAAGLPVGTSAIAIVSAGESAKKMSQIVEQLEVLSGKKAVAPVKTEAKPAAEKKETKPKVPKAKKEVKAEEAPAEAVVASAS